MMTVSNKLKELHAKILLFFYPAQAEICIKQIIDTKSEHSVSVQIKMDNEPQKYNY